MAEKQNDDLEKEEQKQDQEHEKKRQSVNALKFRKTTRRRTHRPARTDGTLPLIPMRGLVVYPGVLLSFDVGREQSVAALRAAMDGRHELILAGQKNLDAEWPETSKIHKIGTRAFVRQILEVSGSSLKILVYGLERVKIDTIIERDQHYEARYHAIDGTVSEKTPELNAALRLLVELFQQYAALTERIPPPVVAMIRNEDDPGHAADVVAGQLSIQFEEQQKILETVPVLKRIRLVLGILHREIQLAELETRIANEVQTQLDKNQRDYYLREQIRVIQEELGEESGAGRDMDSLRERLEKSGIPDEEKPKIEKEINRLDNMPTHFPEYTTQLTWVETLLDLPFGKRTAERHNLARARRILERDHYGMEKVKVRVMEYLAVRKLLVEQQGDAPIRGPILCFVGPPGTGKTSIAKAIAESLGRRYFRLSLGGMRDEAEIRGHRRTYVGAMPGRIIQAIRHVATDNPLILLDEVDKIGNDFRGDPASALLEVLDPEQNNSFQDHYVEIPYDLSQVLFITTANTIDTIPPALYDRMETIEVPGYTEADKIEIGMRHLLPRARKEHGLTGADLGVTRAGMAEIIRSYTAESGVRQLERELARLCRCVAMFIAENDETGSSTKKRLVVGKTKVESFLGKPKYFYDIADKEDQVGVATGLAWTWAGGDTLTIEVNVMPGTGKLKLTGQLGDVMKESAEAALTYILSRSEELGIDGAAMKERDIHIHVPAGAIPKDGPSAGITLATALASALTGCPVRHDYAMTGEITLRGRVLPIGGLKEKSVAAHRAGIRKVLIPEKNVRDIDDVPASVRKDLTFIPVTTMDQVLQKTLVTPPSKILTFQDTETKHIADQKSETKKISDRTSDTSTISIVT